MSASDSAKPDAARMMQANPRHIGIRHSVEHREGDDCREQMSNREPCKPTREADALANLADEFEAAMKRMRAEPIRVATEVERWAQNCETYILRALAIEEIVNRYASHEHASRIRTTARNIIDLANSKVEARLAKPAEARSDG